MNFEDSIPALLTLCPPSTTSNAHHLTPPPGPAEYSHQGVSILRRAPRMGGQSEEGYSQRKDPFPTAPRGVGRVWIGRSGGARPS